MIIEKDRDGRVFSGAPWERKVGYCRAVRRGPFVWVSGTAPVREDGSVFGRNDPERQAMRCLAVIEQALRELGAEMSDVVRTRMFVTDIDCWEEFGRAHERAFGATPPATSMVEVRRLIHPDMLIEIEAEAYLPD